MNPQLSEEFHRVRKDLEAKGHKVYKSLYRYDSESGTASSRSERPYKIDEEVEGEDGDFWAPAYWNGKTYTSILPCRAADSPTPKISKEHVGNMLDKLWHVSQMAAAHRPISGSSEAESAHWFLKKALSLLSPEEKDSGDRLWEVIRNAYNAGRYAEMSDRLTHQHSDIAIIGEPMAIPIIERITGKYKRTSGDLSETKKEILKAYSMGLSHKQVLDAMLRGGEITEAEIDDEGVQHYKLKDEKESFKMGSSWRSKVSRWKALEKKLG